MRKLRLRAENRPGATLVLVAVALVALMGFGALAIDVGMIGTAKAQARRAAEAGALAGAKSYQGVADSARAVAAADSAAWLNSVLNQLVGNTEVQSVLIRDQYRVRTTVTRSNVSLGLASILGYATKTITESAAAAVMTSSAAGCLKPYALPNEAPYNTPDEGAQIHLIWQEGSGSLVTIGFYGDPPGVGELYTDIISTCASQTAILYIDSTTAAKPGNMVTGPTRKGMQDVLCSEVNNGINALRYTPGVGFTRNGVLDPSWRDSPRVGTVALYTPPPGGVVGPGATPVPIAGFINVFFEYMTVDKGGGTQEYIDGYDPGPCGFNGGSNVVVYGRIFTGRGVADHQSNSAICDPTKMVPCVLRLVE